MRRFLLPLVLSASLPALAQTGEESCRKNLGVTWADVQNCMSYLAVAYPDQFKGAVFGYLPAGQAQPLLGAAGECKPGVPCANDTIVWTGSVTKPFTHASALIAMERSDLSMDTRLVDLPNVRPSWIDGDPYAAPGGPKEAITLGQILSMSAGLGERTVAELGATGFFSLIAPSSASCFQQATGQSDPRLQFTGEPGLFNECMWVPSDPGNGASPKIWKPGRNVPLFQAGFYTMRYPQLYPAIGPNRYPLKYSNVSTIIAGWLTEARTGQTLNTFADANIFTPLGMTDTFYNPHTFTTPPLDKLNEGITAAQIARIAHMANKANGVRDMNVPPIGVVPCNGSYWCDVRNWEFLWPEGGLYSTPRDLLVFLRAIRDNTLPAFTPFVRGQLFADQLDLAQAEHQSRTAAFALARNGMAGYVEGQTEGTLLHGGFPGAYMVYDPTRRIAWAFATQRVMRQKGEPPPTGGEATWHFQPNGEVFAEARLFSSLVNALAENQKGEQVNFYFDAARAGKRPNEYLLRYQTRLSANDQWTDGNTACRNVGGACEHQKKVDYYTCAANSAARAWYDLGPNQRPLTVTSTACPWKGTGSRTEMAGTEEFGGPFRLTLDGNSSARIVSNTYSGQYTISLWVRPHATANASIISRSGERVTYQVGIQNGQWLHSSWDTSGVKRTVVGGTVSLNQWHHVVAKATRWGTMSLYVNGVQVGGTSPIGDFLPLASHEYRVGLPANNLGSSPFRGDLGVIAVYAQEHTPADIQRNCNGLKYRFPGATCG